MFKKMKELPPEQPEPTSMMKSLTDSILAALDGDEDVLTTIAMVLGTLIAVVVTTIFLIKAWGKQAYESILNSPKTACDIDAFCGDKYPPKTLKIALAHRFRLGFRKASLEPIPLECTKSPHVPGLYVARNVRRDDNSDGQEAIPLATLLAKGAAPTIPTSGSVIDKMAFVSPTKLANSKKTVVVATIRMGFGHHRIAYSACSWAMSMGYTTIFHDMLNVESEESALIQEVDALYSKFSRMATEFGGPIEKLWGAAMKQGDADALRIASLTAAHLQPLLLAYPKNIPMVTTHQLTALVAAAAGFTNVVNLVVDNYPQWFLVVPRTLNLVQGPINYEGFLRMGVKPRELAWAGHWNPADMVNNLEMDCSRRIQRAHSGFAGSSKNKIHPRRLLIPVGGAGAQKTFILNFIRAARSKIEDGLVELFLNAGDHKHMKEAFEEVLEEIELDYDTITKTEGVYNFQAALLAGKEPRKAITLFAFDEYFPAVATTDILCRVSDVLTCKPSELAFYPIPKLHIRRVGDHEAYSAIRSAELGDGTLEARTIEDAMEYLDLMNTSPDLLVSMNQSILRNKTIGVYDGCKAAVKFAIDGSK